MRRHDVYPGLTGWAQVNGRNAITWQDKFRHDVWYVDNWSFWLDIKIIFMTLWKVIKREGVSQPGQATTEYFLGNPDRITSYNVCYTKLLRSPTIAQRNSRGFAGVRNNFV